MQADLPRAADAGYIVSCEGDLTLAGTWAYAQREDDPLSGIDVSEANAEIPRKVRIDDYTITGLGFALFFFVLWLVPAAWGAYDDIRDSHVRNTLRREGHQADGVVVKSYAGRGSVDVLYKFSVDGFWYPGRAKIIADDYKVQAPGEAIPIRYLPKDPRA